MELDGRNLNLQRVYRQVDTLKAPYIIKDLYHVQPGEKIEAVWQNGSSTNRYYRVLKVKRVDENQVLHFEGGMVFNLKSGNFDSLYDNEIHFKKYTVRFYYP